MTKPKRELKPCPFCGGEAKMTKISTDYSSDGYQVTYQIACNNCWFGFKDTSYFGVTDGVPFISVDGYDALVCKWNRRANDGT